VSSWRPPQIRERAGGAGSLKLVEADAEAGAGDGRTLSGRFAVFNRWTEINSAIEGHFLERIQSGAFAKTIAENADRVPVLFSHGKDPTIGGQILGSLRSLSEGSEGARYEVSLYDGVPPLLLAGLREGKYGSSFRAQVVKEDFIPRPARSRHNPLGLPESLIQEVKLLDVGPTPLPAYDATTAKVRSLDLEALKPRALEFVGERPSWFLERDNPAWLLERSTLK